MKIESKESARQRGVRSPDRAEALMLALCRPPQKFEYFTLSHPPGGSSADGAIPFDDDFDPDDYIGGTRRGYWDAYASGSIARHFRKMAAGKCSTVKWSGNRRSISYPSRQPMKGFHQTLTQTRKLKTAIC
jgi:hypothetical protein